MKSLLPLSMCLTLLVACGEELVPVEPTPTPADMTPTAPDPMPMPMPMPMPEPEPEPEPVWTMPEIIAPTVVMEDLNADPNIVEVNLTAGVTKIQLYDGYKLDMYTYNGTFPGPTLQAKVGDEVIVHFKNELPEPTTVHWHGLRIPDDMDGSPRIQTPVEPGGEFTYRFTVRDAASYWYHPHVRSNEQVEKGLYGALIVHDPEDPVFDEERYIVLDDILLDDDGIAPFLTSHPEIMHGRSGNLLVTNGWGDPVHTTAEQGTVERWRVVNTANARTMSLSIEGAKWRIIGTDGGRIREPYQPNRLTLPVGQRYDLEVRFSRAGEVSLNSHVLVQNGSGGVEERPFPVYIVDVAESERTLPTLEYKPLPAPVERTVNQNTTFELYAMTNPAGGTMWTINGMAHSAEPLATFTEGDTVRLVIDNKMGPEHPFHLHGNFFEIVQDGRAFTQQPGLKDTVLIPGLEKVEIIAYMDNPGHWMAHCHILEHAELGMMGEIFVDPKQ